MVILSKPTNGCAFKQHINRYVACSLDHEQAVLVEDHLRECKSCNGALADAVESGLVPPWLSSLIDRRDVGGSQSANDGSINPSTVSMVIAPPGERYQSVGLLGQGGMGQVWRAWDTVMKRAVALKQLRTDKRSQTRDRRLLQEATSLARLSHRNIVAVYEVLMLDEQPTLVMELVDGPTLSAMGRDLVMSERQAANILEQLADAVAHAHSQSVIHRDLKPSNVLLSWPKEAVGKSNNSEIDLRAIEHAIPKLTDFGLAKTLEGDDLTRTGELLGTPAYMAPEQTLGLTSVLGQAADIYGLGAILYDLLTGTPPHVGQDPVATMLLVREREPTAPRIVRPELSKDIETICLKCLEKVPNQRYTSASALRDDLRAYLDGRPISARPAGLMRACVRWSRRHKSIVVSVVLAVCLLLTLVIGSLWTASKERQLRVAANLAQRQAEQSEEKLNAEAERANRALEVNRKHFEVALDRVNRLALLAYNPNNKSVSTLDFGREIQVATTDIYATYLSTLPAPELWTLDEAYAVTYYIKYMVALGNRDLALPWLERMTSIAPRLEREADEIPKGRELLAQHYTNAHVQAYAVDDFGAAGSSGEQLSRFVDVDARHAAFVLVNSALSYLKANRPSDAVRAVNQAVHAYRTTLDKPNSQPDDAATFLDKLRWHRYVSRQAGDQQEADKFADEFAERLGQFQPDSPYYARVQESAKAYYSH